MHYVFGVKYFYERYNCMEIMKKFICLTDERHPELPLQDDLNFIWLVEQAQSVTAAQLLIIHSNPT